MDLLVKGGLVVNEYEERHADILVRQGKIVAIDKDIAPPEGVRVIDAQHRLLLPGVIDVHTHFGMVNARGQKTADGFWQGSVSAACGGVTTVIDYADPLPGESLLEAAAKRRQEALESIAIDFALHVVVSTFRESDIPELQALVDFGISSVGEVFTSHPTLKIAESDLRLLLSSARDAGVLVTMHAEDDSLLQNAQRELRESEKLDQRYYGESRPVEAEVRAIDWLVEMAAELKCPLYIVHVSSGEGCRIIGEARQRGLSVMGETCPHYLLLTDESYQASNAYEFTMNPPLRPREDQAALWEGLASKTLQIVTTDHCSYTPAQKRSATSWCEAWPGVPGSETLLPLMYSEGVGKGRLKRGDLVRLLAGNPARIFGLYPRKGVLAVGSDADIVIFDPMKQVTITASRLHSAALYTPFAGWSVQGYPITTILRGRVIYAEEEFCGELGGGVFVAAERGSYV